MTDPPRFCPRCATPLRTHGRDDRRPWCPACPFVHYLDPKLAVVVLVQDPHGRLLYMQRNHQPKLGAWAWPAGFVDAGENVRHAAQREVREETGIEIQLTHLLGIWSGGGDPVVLIAWSARPTGGHLTPGPEARNAAWRHPTQIPPTFPHDQEILAAWQNTHPHPPPPS